MNTEQALELARKHLPPGEEIPDWVLRALIEARGPEIKTELNERISRLFFKLWIKQPEHYEELEAIQLDLRKLQGEKSRLALDLLACISREMGLGY
jgi:hypothetical protein